MKNYFRQLLLNWARKIVEREGLTCADIREVGNTFYLVDRDNQFYKIAATIDPTRSQKIAEHNLQIIK